MQTGVHDVMWSSVLWRRQWRHLTDQVFNRCFAHQEDNIIEATKRVESLSYSLTWKVSWPALLAPANVVLPATAPVFYFEELAEVVPTCVSYCHNDTYWWNLGYFHDGLHDALDCQCEPMQKFVQTIKKRLLSETVQTQLGMSVYVKPCPTRPTVISNTEYTWC